MWIDAHNHLHDARLPRVDVATVAAYQARGIDRMVVNGTCEEDWLAVASLARQFPDFIIPSFGLHPWKVSAASGAWQSTLRGHLSDFPAAAIGEIGLDQWIPNPDPRLQADAFAWQCQLAAELDRPITIHCLKAWDALFSLWPSLPSRPGRVLIHGFTGPQDLAGALIRRGCLLGFGGHTLVPRKLSARDAFAAIPAEALLLETDAPDMPAPDDIRTDFLSDHALNHPANLIAHGHALASLRRSSPEDLATRLHANFQRWWMG
jgi:TatD DNase family protein